MQRARRSRTSAKHAAFLRFIEQQLRGHAGLEDHDRKASPCDAVDQPLHAIGSNRRLSQRRYRIRLPPVHFDEADHDARHARFEQRDAGAVQAG